MKPLLTFNHLKTFKYLGKLSINRSLNLIRLKAIIVIHFITAFTIISRRAIIRLLRLRNIHFLILIRANLYFFRLFLIIIVKHYHIVFLFRLLSLILFILSLCLLSL